MAVQNNQLANETTFNTRLMSRTVDTSTLGRVDLLNALAVSGPNVLNVQRNINALASALGIPINQVFNYLHPWVYSYIGLPTDTVVQKIEALIQRFDGIAGHNHNGTDGSGAKISAVNLVDINPLQAVWQGDSLTGVTGSSVDVSGLFSGKQPGGSATNVGVITTPPSNRVQLFNPDDGSFIEDSSGKRVFGRLIENAGVWEIEFFVFNAGAEVPHTFATAQDILFYYLEVFDLQNRPTIPATPDFSTLNVSADVPDATPTVRGLVNTVSQTFAGNKTFNGNIKLNSDLKGNVAVNNQSGSNVVLNRTEITVIALQNPGLTSIAGINAIAGDNAKIQFVANKTSNPIDVIHNSGPKGFLIPGEEDFELGVNQAMLCLYDEGLDRWQVISGAGTGGGGVGYYETPAGAVNGSNVTFGPLTFVPTQEEAIIVYVDGLALLPSEFSYSGGNVILNTAPVPGQTVTVFYTTYGTPIPPPVFSNVFKVEYRTLTAAEIAAKQLQLDETPVSPSEILVDVQGGSSAFYGDDFIVSGDLVQWNGLGLDGLLAAGDKLRIGYVY
jgi:hypothetical protein